MKYLRNIKNIITVVCVALVLLTTRNLSALVGGDSWNFLNGDSLGVSAVKLSNDLDFNKVEKISIGGSYGKWNNTPNVVYEGSLLYTLDDNNDLVIFDLTKKKVIQKIKLGNINKGVGTSGLALYDDYIYISLENGTILAYSLLSNVVLWQTNLATPVNSAPVVDENKLFVVANNNIYALDINNGDVLWNYLGSQSGVSFKKLYIPVVYKDFIMIGLSSSDFLVLLKNTGELYWKKNLSGLILGDRANSNPTLGDIKAAPLTFEDKVFVATNNRVSLLSISKQETLWQISTIGSYSNAIKYKNEIIVMDLFNNLVSVDANKSSENWRYNFLGDIATKEKVYWNNLLLLNEDNILLNNSIGEIFIFSIKDKKIIEKKQLYDSGSEKIYYSPVVREDGLIFISSKGNLYFISIKE